MVLEMRPGALAGATWVRPTWLAGQEGQRLRTDVPEGLPKRPIDAPERRIFVLRTGNPGATRERVVPTLTATRGVPNRKAVEAAVRAHGVTLIEPGIVKAHGATSDRGE